MLSQGLLLCAAVIAPELLLYCKFTLVFAAVAAAVSGARSRNRTGTLLPARDFKSLVSTYFTIRAAVLLYLATPKGFEPLTHSLEGCCSIQLS